MGIYIVELKKNETLYKATTRESDGTAYVCSAMGTPYTAPDLEQVREEAYEKGKMDAYVEDSKNITVLKEEAEEAYQQGLTDAWEAARKICTNWVLPDSVLSEIFGMGKTIDDIMKENTASEVIAKIRAYEQEKEEIKVGDEVTEGNHNACALYENPDGTQVTVLKQDGTTAWWCKSAIHRTGRTFPEIATILEKMRESE